MGYCTFYLDSMLSLIFLIDWICINLNPIKRLIVQVILKKRRIHFYFQHIHYRMENIAEGECFGNTYC